MPVMRTKGGSPGAPFIPDPKTVATAQRMIQRLSDDGARFVLLDRETRETVEIDEAIFRLFRQLLVDLAQNRPVSIIPVDHELTTHQAAALLNVSRPFLIGLLSQGQLPYRLVGTHRRIRLEDLLAYKAEQEVRSDKAMDELAALAQEHKLGY